MKRVLAWLLGLALAVNGALMLAKPRAWYGAVPRVAETGPFNPHFVRDIGCACLVCGAAILAFALDRRARSAAFAAGAFLALHALVHVWDWAAGREAAGQLLRDLPSVGLPPLLVLWLAFLPHDPKRRNAMLNWLIRRRLAAFEREYDYDAGYMREIAAVSTGALRVYANIERMARYRRDVPRDAYFAAKLVAVLAEDCGPCTQLVATMAERAGMAPAEIRAVLTRDRAAMGEAASLGFRFAEAVLAHDPAADGLRDEVVRRWGRHALVSLAYAMASTRVFPMVKYALGHGEACRRVTVGGAPVPVLREAAA